DLRVQAGKRDTRIEDLQNTVHVADLFFHQTERFGHMPREPLDLPAVDNVVLTHSITPIASNGMTRYRATPSTSRSSTQPISRSRLSLDWLRLSPIRKRHPFGTVIGKFTLSCIQVGSAI